MKNLAAMRGGCFIFALLSVFLTSCVTVRDGNTPEEIAIGKLLGDIKLPKKDFREVNPGLVIEWIFEQARLRPELKKVKFVFDRTTPRKDWIEPAISVSFEETSILESIGIVGKLTSWKFRIYDDTLILMNRSCAGMPQEK